jgi:hypothetical protein
MFFVDVQLLAVNRDKLGNDTSVQIQHWVADISFSLNRAYVVYTVICSPVNMGQDFLYKLFLNRCKTKINLYVS